MAYSGIIRNDSPWTNECVSSLSLVTYGDISKRGVEESGWSDLREVVETERVFFNQKPSNTVSKTNSI